VGGIQYGMGHNPQPVKNTMLVHFTGQPGNTFTIEREISDHKDEYAIDLDNRYAVSSLPSILKPGVTMYCRIFVRDIWEFIPGNWADSGQGTLLANTSGKEYKYLIAGNKIKKNLRVKYLTQLQLFTLITFDGITYEVERISNIDVNNLFADIDAVELSN
jgi:hypothetical protein